MKFQSFGLAALLTFLTVSSMAAAAPTARFSVGDVRGGYGFSVLGFAASMASAGAGVFTADGKGNITAGQLTLNVNGVSCHSTLNGTYTVNADGSGTLTLILTEDPASSAKNCQSLATHFSLALTDGGRQILLAQQDSADVAKGVAFKQ
jgi:hypothetical protein